ncbi:MAG: TIGR02996 domain-containing protein, partial [Myxococcota bacterium]
MSDLDMALDLWRRTRLDECARVVAVLTPTAEARGPLPSGRPAARHEAWLAVARLDDPADVSWLLASVVGSAVEPSADRLERLVGRGPHPLVGASARQWILAGHFRTHRAHRWWGLVREVAGWSSSDVDFAELAERLRRWPSQDMLRLAREVATWGRIAVSPTRPSDEEQRQLDVLSARVPPPPRPRRSDRTGRDLLEAVFDDPAADGPRAVLADFLIGRGDPRGTFLQLQLARAERSGPAVHARHRLPREEWELLFDHEARWFGAPFPAMVTGAPERGFFAQVRISSHADQLRTLIAAPGLRTIRHLGVVRRTIRVRKALHELLTCPALRHLQRVGSLWPEDVDAIAGAAARPRWIEVAPRGARLDQLGRAVTQLPTLERLDLPAHPDRMEALATIAVPTLGISAAAW